MRNLLCDESELNEVKKKIKECNARMPALEQNFENSFLIASGETLKKLYDYTQLQQSVIEVNENREEKQRL